MPRVYCVYIATDATGTVLYTGAACNIHRRMFEHASKAHPSSFTAKNKIDRLVYVESTRYVYNAIEREKQIKGWTRKKKEDLINSINPDWNNLLDYY